ncbi:hypothetical protein PR202_ga11327 [Eleusine coracana subsp. coracana]|uniref:Retrotransposon gag domain-containing protein n=1 Tax=Eleusine coracana subsp. coracana TaxID=191504 RepID=A0AAV5C9B3_ELECO|nr:hypothetical protein PR202_ga11327 [Eleusine coracana subsp. coracana]
MQMMPQFFVSMMESQQQQAEFMREVAQQNLANRNTRGHHDGAPQNSSYSDFLATRLPMFSSTTEPMEAENFLRMLESKFGLLNCTSMQKTLFAAQQLHGAAGAWWANHVASMGTDRQITWDEFKDAFRAHYIPAGLIRRKAREFAALKQGSRSVEEYCEEFNRLALYAPEQVDTPAKRKDRFLEGLSAELQDHLNLNMGGTFAEFVNNAIVTEDGFRRVMAERKRSASAMGPSNGPPQKFRMVVYTTPVGTKVPLAPVPAPVVRPPQPAQQRPPLWINSNKFCKGSRLKGLEKEKKKKNCRGTHLSATQRKTAAGDNSAEAALPRPSRAAWSPAYGQRPLPRIDGPTRAFGHPFCRPPRCPSRIHFLSLALSPPSPLLPPLLLLRTTAASPSLPGARRRPRPRLGAFKLHAKPPSPFHIKPPRIDLFLPASDRPPHPSPGTHDDQVGECRCGGRFNWESQRPDYWNIEWELCTNEDED